MKVPKELEFITSICNIDQGTGTGWIKRRNDTLFFYSIFSLQIFEIDELASKGYAEVYHPDLYKPGTSLSTKCD